MKKSDLKSGMWVECRNGNKYMIILDYNEFFPIIGVRDGGWIVIKSLNEDLTSCSELLSNFDIIKVYTPKSIGQIYNGSGFNLIWQRKEHTELSVSEIEAKLGLKSGTLRIKKED